MRFQEKTDLEKCFWKAIAEKDRKKLENGNKCITLSENKKCYRCSGTKERAEEMQCLDYIPKKYKL